MAYHHKTVETGGWLLLLGVIALVLYLLFHKSAQAGGTVVTSTIGGKLTGPPLVTPNDPTSQSTYIATDGTIWQWDVSGQQWYRTANALPPNFYAGATRIV